MLSLQRSRQIRFEVRFDDPHAIPKQIAGISQAIRNILEDMTAPPLGSSTLVHQTCANDATALLRVHYVNQEVNFPSKKCLRRIAPLN